MILQMTLKISYKQEFMILQMILKRSYKEINLPKPLIRLIMNNIIL